MPIQLQTPDSFQYVFYPLPSQNSLTFTVKAPANCSVILSKQANPGEYDPVLEVLIGVTENTKPANKSAIRRDRTMPYKVVTDTPRIVNGKQARGFWINYQGGVVTVGKQNEISPFLSWVDPAPFDVSYIGVNTFLGATGEWVIDGETINTPGNFKHVYRPVPHYCLGVDVQASKCAYIVLTSGPEITIPMYDMVLGGWHNKASAIRYNQEEKPKVVVRTPGLMSASVPQHFRVSWRNGLVRVTRGNCGPLMKWRDPKPFQVTYFGVRTAYGTTGTWTIDIVKDNNGKAAALAWVRGTKGVLPPNSVVGGLLEPSNDSAYVGRVYYENALQPGYIVSTKGYMWAIKEDCSSEKYHSQYEYLTGTNFKWQPSQNGDVPFNAVVGGYDNKGSPLFIGRATERVGRIIPGKGCYHWNYDKQQVEFSEKGYDILLQE